MSQITSSPQNRSENKTSLKTPAATDFRLFWQQFHVILIQVTTAFWGSATCCVNCCHCELSGGWSWLGQLLPLQGPISHHLNENFEHFPSPAWHIQGSLHTGAVDELLVQQLVPGEVWSRRRNRFGGSNLKCQVILDKISDFKFKFHVSRSFRKELPNVEHLSNLTNFKQLRNLDWFGSKKILIMDSSHNR